MRHSCGSPPRMWGRRSTTPSSAARQAVYPHACGEDSSNEMIPALYHGSPPRMWGRPVGVAQELVVDRFTPTHVGKTFTETASGIYNAVHPHACGEDEPGAAGGAGALGSPPRMWGRLQHLRLRCA